jgi:hypothetical protein
MPDIPLERFVDQGEAIVWPGPRPQPSAEPVDHHLGPLDRAEDRRWLRQGDPRLRDPEGEQ